MKDDLIRRGDACAELLKCADVYNPDYSDITVTYAVKTVSAIPAVDAVEVVRCRECLYWHDEEDSYCSNLCIDTHPDFYCANASRKRDGQRREEEHNAAD